MARHIELEPPSVNNIVQMMNSGLATYEKDRKHKFVNMVFKKLTKKIENDMDSPKDNDLASSSNHSTTEENSSEDDNIDSSMNYLDSSENISN